MRTALRWGVAAVVAAHGLIHLLGAVKGLDLWEVPELALPVSTTAGVVWLVTGVLVVAAAVLFLLRHRYTWIVAGIATVASQALIVAFWGDARAGTAANVLLLAVAVYEFAARGPRSFRAQYARLADTALRDTAGPVPVVHDVDLVALPSPVARYLRRCDVVGRPRVVNFRAALHGRIRGGPTKPWMPFTAQQVSTYGPHPTRLFLMDATMFGLPVDVLHVCRNGRATMRAKLLSLIPTLNSAGPEMDRGETVTLFNDLCVFAPAALVDADVAWTPVDERHVRGAFTNGDQTVTAELVFDEDGDLVDFVSDDRLRASPDGTSFTRQRWSTPLRDYHGFGMRRLSSTGEARWHDPEAGEFTYGEMHLDDISYNVGVARTPTRRPVTTAGLSR